MDLKKTQLKAAERIRQDDTENLCRLAARLTQMQAETGIGAPETTGLSHALYTRRRLRRPLSTTR
jgi:hypothetical protein